MVLFNVGLWAFISSILLTLAFYRSIYNVDRVIANLTVEKMKTIEMMLARTVDLGGSYTPAKCTPTERIAIVIPFRDRQEHLTIFLRFMHPYLQRQQLKYRIFVIEMDKEINFNAGVLKNIGFVEAMKLENYTCFVFHDVDLLPEDDRIPYSCASVPQHLAFAMDKFNYRLPYKGMFGGVFSFRTEQFRETNGMSNMFFRWGGEDDDIYKRILTCHLRIQRPPLAIARYLMLKHTEDKDKNPERFCLLRSAKQRMHNDGLSNLKYSLMKLEIRPLYTRVLVRVNEKEQIESDTYSSQFLKNCQKENKVQTHRSPNTY